MAPVYALNLFDLADNDDYLRLLASGRSTPSASTAARSSRSGGSPTAPVQVGDTEPRQVMVLVEWPSPEAFQAFLDDPGHEDLHPLRENGTERYLWWPYEKLSDLRPVLKRER